jgi:hypothetical protein
MTDPNKELGIWLFSVLDPKIPVSAFSLESSRDRPFTYDDLVAVGKDSVIVRKNGMGTKATYSIEFASLYSYEEFIAE